MSDFELSTEQLQVIDALSSGATITRAAAQAGVHRNTIANWRRNHLPFRESLANAHYDKALLVREQYEIRLERAFQVLDDLLSDPATPASIRLKAATFLIQNATEPGPPQTQFVMAVQPAKFPDFMHNHAQSAQPTPPPSAPVRQPSAPPPVHNHAQSPKPAPLTIHRQGPKIGRNELCPCGSGIKFKRCCLDKPLAAAA
jgi:transposase-like protein